MKTETTTIVNNRIEIITTSGGNCIGGHTWTFSGSRDYVLEGTLCDCGMKQYEKPKYCDKCGHQLQNNPNPLTP